MNTNKPNEFNANEMVTALGAMGEILAVLRDSLIKSGFTKKESIEMCKALLINFMHDKRDTNT